MIAHNMRCLNGVYFYYIDITKSNPCKSPIKH